MMTLAFTSDEFGNQSLINKKYEGDVFPDITLFPVAPRTVMLRNIQFANCKTSPGTCMIGGNVILDNVVFSNFDCGDALHIYSEVVLRQVTVIGQKPASLIVQPNADNESFVQTSGADVDYHLDVSDFLGEVVVVGFYGNKVRKNSERHVTIRSRWKEEVDWMGLGIGPLSYWKLYLRKLASFSVEEGVFSLPEPNNKHFETTIRERRRLEEIGLSFD